MLGGLGRWLRAAGYDTLIAGGGRPDAEWVRCATAQARRLLTRDRGIPERYPHLDNIVLLRARTLEEAVGEVASRLDVDWLHRPFARCLVCNTPLEPRAVAPANRVPPRVLADDVPLRHCPCCDKYYWEGSHVRRMRRRLCDWRAGAAGQGAEEAATDRPRAAGPRGDHGGGADGRSGTTAAGRTPPPAAH